MVGAYTDDGSGGVVAANSGYDDSNSGNALGNLGNGKPCSECDALRAEILRLRAALEAANMKVKQAALLFSWHYYAPSPAV